MQVDNLDLRQELKSVTNQLTETERILDESQTEEAQLRVKFAATQKELSSARSWRTENEPRLLGLEKENRTNLGQWWQQIRLLLYNLAAVSLVHPR